MGSQTRKLAELRAKTDHQLLNLLNFQLERGFEYARLMEEAHAAGQRAEMEQWHAHAYEAYCEASRLASMSPKTLESQRLNAALDRLRAFVEPAPAQAACF